MIGTANPHSYVKLGKRGIYTKFDTIFCRNFEGKFSFFDPKP